ncbi:MAG: winged helix-turn-helix transcriptional regulator [Clostridia bacterium]|nr:winged helix-turn-helix transcriptional regulator [Clostridia bacterium]
MVERFEKFTFALAEISRYWNRIAADEMKKYNLKAPFAVYLITMYRHSEGLTAARLCELCGKDKSEVSRAVSLLTERGLAVREEVNNNSYRALLRLTEEGKKAAAQVCERANLAVEYGGRGISDEHRDILYKSLDTIVSNLYNISKEGLPDESC